MEFQAVIMAAGRGSRMTDLTAKVPKALLPVGNKPLVWYPLQLLIKSGFEEAIVIVHKSSKKQIERVLVDECGIKMKLDLVTIPDEEDWGTADSLRHIKDKIKADLLVISCDLITDVSLHKIADIHRAHNATITTFLSSSKELTTEIPIVPGPKTKKKTELDFVGLDEVGNRLLFLSSEADFEECITFRKSVFKKHPCINIHTRLTDSHLYLVRKWVVDYLVDHPSMSSLKGEVIPHLLKQQFSKRNQFVQNDISGQDDLDKSQDIYQYYDEDDMFREAQSMSSWNDHSGDMDECYHGDKIRCYALVQNDGLCTRVNTLLSYCEANRQISKYLPSLQTEKDVPTTHPTATINQKSQVGVDCLVGESVTIDEKVGVKRSNIGKNCVIGEKVKITNCVLMGNVKVKEGSNIQGCVVCDNVTIGERSELKDCIVTNNQTVNPKSKLTNEIIADIDRMMQI